MKKYFVTIAILIGIIVIMGIDIVNLKDDLSKNYTAIVVNTDKEKIVFAGDSITDGYDVNSYYQYDDKIIVNSGIGGYKTSDILRRFYNVIEQHQADKMFLLIGTNDLSAKVKRDTIVNNIKEIIVKTKETTPNIKIYYETIYPVNPNVKNVGARNNKDIKYINEKIKEYCESNGIVYIDVFDKLVDEDGNLNSNYTSDGLHLNKNGYDVVTNLLRPFVEE